MVGSVAVDRVRNLGLNDYQKWVELDWKKPHSSVEAFERFSVGLVGEIVELNDEVDPLLRENSFRNWKRREDFEKPSKESISELGDVLWYGTALLGNAQIDLETCFREYLHEKWEPVDWGEAFTVGEVQGRIENHTPYPFPRRNVGDLFLEDIDEERAISRDLHYSGYTIAALLRRIFNEERITTDPRTFMQAIGVERVGGLFVAYVAYHAAKTLGSSLEEVIVKNVEKISLRVERNHVDKSDGQRSAEEN